MLIYRICKPYSDSINGYGPYGYNEEISNLIQHHGTCPFHPTPSRDGIAHYDIAKEWNNEPYYAFQNLQALYAWFGDIFSALHKYGFVIRVLDTPDKECYTGRSGQCIFNSNWTTVVCDVGIGGDLTAIKKRVSRKMKHANREYRARGSAVQQVN